MPLPITTSFFLSDLTVASVTIRPPLDTDD
jgi:hypothetical protein